METLAEMKKSRFYKERFLHRNIKKNKQGLYLQYGRYHIIPSGKKSKFKLNEEVRVNTGLRDSNIFEVFSNNKVEIWKISEKIFPKALLHFRKEEIGISRTSHLYQGYILISEGKATVKEPIYNIL